MVCACVMMTVFPAGAEGPEKSPASVLETPEAKKASPDAVEGQGAEHTTPLLKEASEKAVEETPKPEHPSPWFVLPSLINVYPKMKSEELIEKYYNPAMRLFAPGFKDANTVGGLRDKGMLWTPDFSIGRTLGERWAVYAHFGYMAGKVRTEEENRSIFLAIFRTDFEIYRSAIYLGLCTDFYPWGMPERKKYASVWEMVKNTKPRVGLHFTETWAGYRVKVKAGFTEHTNFLSLKLRDKWQVPGINTNVGVDIPLGKKDALSMNAGYNFALKRSFDFDAVAISLGWKHYFK